MKLRKSVFAAIAATLLIAVSMQAKDEMKRIYIFGFASSFNDSIVCFTDVQAVDSAWLNSKNHFLVSREDYSYQLRDYLEGEGYKQIKQNAQQLYRSTQEIQKQKRYDRGCSTKISG